MIIILCLILGSSLIWLGWNYYILAKRFLDLTNNFDNQQKQYLADFSTVVNEIQDFIYKSKYLEYSDEVKSLLTFLRSFVQRLDNYITKATSDFEKEQEEKEEPNSKLSIPSTYVSRNSRTKPIAFVSRRFTR